MTSPQVERTGVLVIRLWSEERGEGGLRARITTTLDISRPNEVVSVAATVEGIAAAVREWLDAFIAA